jgi:hypothetical protein
MFDLMSEQKLAHNATKTKVTCVTCKLKKCVGRCHFEAVGRPQPQKA